MGSRTDSNRNTQGRCRPSEEGAAHQVGWALRAEGVNSLGVVAASDMGVPPAVLPARAASAAFSSDMGAGWQRIGSIQLLAAAAAASGATALWALVALRAFRAACAAAHWPSRPPVG